jgi:hypothetical protein
VLLNLDSSVNISRRIKLKEDGMGIACGTHGRFEEEQNILIP